MTSKDLKWIVFCGWKIEIFTATVSINKKNKLKGGSVKVNLDFNDEFLDEVFQNNNL